MWRKILFWSHLSAGVFAGLVVLIMSVTGVLLAFQRQITDFADRRNLAPIVSAAGSQPLSIEDVLAKVNVETHALPTAVTVRNSPNEPYSIELGRERVVYVDPYSGNILGEGSRGVRHFFRVMTDWHRWLGADQESRPVGRAITGACNLLFLFIVLSGPFLWLPRKWSWATVRAILLFRRRLSGKARDFNWHNVTGIWCTIPLVVVVATAVVMSYPWANNALYRLTGSEPPSQQERPPNPGLTPKEGANPGHRERKVPSFAGLEIPLNRAKEQDATWQQITMRIPSGPSPISFSILNGTEGRPDRRAQLMLARGSGEVVRWEPFTSNNAGRRLRIWFRFLHTGEALGVVGQMVAGIASAGGVFLAYTGYALAIRRLLAWVRRRRSQRQPELQEVETAR